MANGRTPGGVNQHSTPRHDRVRRRDLPDVDEQAPAGRVLADRELAGGIGATGILALQRNAGNQAVAALLARAGRAHVSSAPPATSARPASSGPTVQRSGQDEPEGSVLVATIVGMHDVPATLKGRALKIHLVARYGRLSRKQAAALVDKTGVPSGGIRRQRNGAVTFMLSPAEEAMILRLRRPERSDKANKAKGERKPPVKIDPERTVAEKVAVGAADLGTDFAPVVSNLKDATIALTGVNPVTGERVGIAGRVASAIFAIPVLGNLAKLFGKGGRLLWKGLKLLGPKLKKLTGWLKRRLGKLTGKAGRRALRGVTVTIDPRKFSEYVFKEGATHGKDKVFRGLGYGREHSELLVEQYRKQASERYASGAFEYGKKDQYGQRIDIEITLEGIGDAAGKTSHLRSGWLIRPDGSLSLNTPFSGFMR